MPSSMGPAAEALDALLAAAAWPAPTPQLVFGPPAEYEEQQVVSVLGIDDPGEESAALGNQRRDENYVLDVRIKVHDPSATTAREVFLRGLALREVVRATVAANSTLKGTVMSAQVVGGGLTDGVGGTGTTAIALPAHGGGWVAFGAARVACRARIT